MTNLEMFLLVLLYIISGSFSAYKQYTCRSIENSNESLLAIFAFFLNPIFIIWIMAKALFVKQW